MIKDSGARTTFETGAVRDVQDDKGRCDLIPLSVVANMFFYENKISSIIHNLDRWKKDGQVQHLNDALMDFAFYQEINRATMLLEVSIHFKQGAEKYGEYNWQKGIPTRSYLDSAVRHLLKVIRGDDDERHDRAFVWNIMCLIWTLENKPELDDVEHEGKEDEK